MQVCEIWEISKNEKIYTFSSFFKLIKILGGSIIINIITCLIFFVLVLIFSQTSNKIRGFQKKRRELHDKWRECLNQISVLLQLLINLLIEKITFDFI